MNIVFVNYGDFGNNSSNHIDGFARGLIERGHEVGLVAQGELTASIPGAGYQTFDGVSQGGDARPVVEMLRSPSTVLHGWTPRESVRRWIEPLAAAGLRYVVHLEDDEGIITASQLRRSQAELRALSGVELDELVPPHLSHPVRYRTFLERAAGVTVIVEALRSLAPRAMRTAVVAPGADLALFSSGCDPGGRAARRASLGIEPGTTLLAYHGGIHPAIQQDMFSLYTAVAKLRHSGHDVVLLRLGTSRNTTKTSAAFRRAEGVLQVPAVPRAELPSWLDLADIYVQPGAPTVFNVRRLPSKLLDFFSMGRPVILPAVYAGVGCMDGRDAIHLVQGGAEEIARCVRRLMTDLDLMQRIGHNGREWVEREFQWDAKVDVLERFYEAL